MELHAVSGHQDGLDVTVEWEECPNCGLIRDEHGHIHTPDDIARHQKEMDEFK